MKVPHSKKGSKRRLRRSSPRKCRAKSTTLRALSCMLAVSLISSGAELRPAGAVKNGCSRVTASNLRREYLPEPLTVDSTAPRSSYFNISCTAATF
jgi:hypothetical protein